MMRTLKYSATLAFAALLAACSKDPTEAPAPLPQSSDLPIRWKVKEVVAPAGNTRALIGNDREDTDPEGSTDPTHPDYFLPLSEACTVPENDPDMENGFAVGLFGDFSYEKNGETVTVYDLYRGTRLVYLPDASEDLPSKWDTNAGAKYWYSAAQYIFRAYYPQRLHTYTVSTSNATTLALVYPTRKLQYDLLLGYAAVDTSDKDWSGEDPVELQMNHALAALRFEFQLRFENTDWLTSIYLLSDKGRHYISQGTVIYGTKNHLDSLAWLQDYNPPANEELYKWIPPAEYWGGPTAADPKGKSAAVLERELEERLEGKSAEEVEQILAENPAIMRTTKNASNDYVYHNAKGYSIAREGDQAVEGPLYTRNSGWLLIIPQESYGKLMLCFTTKKGGEVAYSVALPRETGTKLSVKDAKGNVVEKDVWQAGMRYTYLVTLSQSDLDIAVSIKPWNERKHSTEIIF